MIHSHVGPEPIDVTAVTRMVMRPGNGAIATFLGTVRDSAGGAAVTGLDYSAYTEMAQKELAAIVAEAEHKAAGTDVAAVHRLGALGIGDISVAIAVGHPHRAEAFDACRYVIEQMKRRVPIWKREHYATGDSEWVDPSGAPAGRTSLPVER